MEGQAAGSILSGQHQPPGFLRLISRRSVTFAIQEAQERPVELGQLTRCRRVDDGLQEMWDVVRGRHAPVYRPERHRLVRRARCVVAIPHLYRGRDRWAHSDEATFYKKMGWTQYERADGDA